MAELIARFGPYGWGVHEPGAALLRAVVGQQIGNAQARARFARLEAEGFLDPGKMVAAGPERLRQLGFSRTRARTLLGVAELGRSGVLAGLDLMSDQEVRALVLPVFGIGPWTADMLLIFGLGRLDVWPVTDLGLRVGVAMSYPEEQPLALGERFAPYRSAAAWYFWNLADQNQRVKLNKP